MYYSGWAPLLTLRDWDVATVGDPLDDVFAGQRDAHVATTPRSVFGLSSIGVSQHHARRDRSFAFESPSATGVSVSASPPLPFVRQTYFGHGVSVLRFLAPSTDAYAPSRATQAGTRRTASSSGNAPSSSGRHAHPRAANLFAAVHRRFHVKTRDPLPQHAGLVYMECQRIASGADDGTSEEAAGSTHGEEEPSGGTQRVPLPVPLVVGICTASLPTQVLPGEAADSIGFWTHSRIVYAHGRTEAEKVSFVLQTPPPLEADGTRRRRQRPRNRASVCAAASGVNGTERQDHCPQTEEETGDARVHGEEWGQNDEGQDGEEDEEDEESEDDMLHNASGMPPPRHKLDVGDTIGCLVDFDDGTVRFTVNRRLVGDYVGRLPTHRRSREQILSTTTHTTPPASAYFFAVGVTQRTPAVSVRVVLQAGLNARPRIPLTLPASVYPYLTGHETSACVRPHTGHTTHHASSPQKRQEEEGEVHCLVNVVFPLYRFVRRLGARATHALPPPAHRDDESPTLSAVPLPPSHRDEADTASGLTSADQAAMDVLLGTHSNRASDAVAPWKEESLNEEAVLSLIETHLAMRGMHRALAALGNEADALGMTDVTQACAEPYSKREEEAQQREAEGVDETGSAHVLMSDPMPSFALFMARLRDAILSGGTGHGTLSSASSTSSSTATMSLVDLFLSRAPLSDAVESRVRECARAMTDAQTEATTAAQPIADLRAPTARQLALSFLARHLDVFALLCVMPLLESVVEAVSSQLCPTVAGERRERGEAQARATLTPADVWSRFLHSVLVPVHALAALPDPAETAATIAAPTPRPTENPPVGNSEGKTGRQTAASVNKLASLQMLFYRSLSQAHASTECAEKKDNVGKHTKDDMDGVLMSMLWLLQAAMPSVVSPHSVPSSSRESSRARGLRVGVDASAPDRVALGHALVALLQLAASSSPQRNRAWTPNAAFTTAVQRVLNAAVCACRQRVWQHICHAVEATNELAVLHLTRWEQEVHENAQDVSLAHEEADAEGSVDLHRHEAAKRTSDRVSPVLSTYRSTSLASSEAVEAVEEDEAQEEEVDEEEYPRDGEEPEDSSSYSGEGFYAFEGLDEEVSDRSYDVLRLFHTDHAQHGEEEDEEGLSEREPPESEPESVTPVQSHPSSSSSSTSHAAEAAVSRADGQPAVYFYTTTSPSTSKGKTVLDTQAVADAGADHARCAMRSRRGSRAWRALSLRRAWRRVLVTAALQPSAYASTSAFLSQWKLSELRLIADSSAVGEGGARRDGSGRTAVPGAAADRSREKGMYGEEEARVCTFTDAEAHFLIQLEAHTRAIYDLL